jgi:hypothetical protein
MELDKLIADAKWFKEFERWIPLEWLNNDLHFVFEEEPVEELKQFLAWLKESAPGYRAKPRHLQYRRFCYHRDCSRTWELLHEAALKAHEQQDQDEPVDRLHKLIMADGELKVALDFMNRCFLSSQRMLEDMVVRTLNHGDSEPPTTTKYQKLPD